MDTHTLKEQIHEDMKAAMRAREQDKLTTIRLILAAIKQREVDERITLNNEQILAVLNKMLKQRRDSAAQFSAAGRKDLADKENLEISLIQAYLPAQLSDAEIKQLIDQAFAQTGASTLRDMGKLMAELKPKLQGRADLGAVSVQIKERLSE